MHSLKKSLFLFLLIVLFGQSAFADDIDAIGKYMTVANKPNDVISSQPFITVDYENHQTALQVGDSLVIWKIMTADYQDRTVKFQNDKGQFVKITLND